MGAGNLADSLAGVVALDCELVDLGIGGLGFNVVDHVAAVVAAGPVVCGDNTERCGPVFAGGASVSVVPER
ncbi:MAG TPA: hypothetical protein VMY41_12325 [Thermohalobaculum sp.]|nr:hypothetical protein [Thermohalobaculum sp.]